MWREDGWINDLRGGLGFRKLRSLEEGGWDDEKHRYIYLAINEQFSKSINELQNGRFMNARH